MFAEIVLLVVVPGVVFPRGRYLRGNCLSGSCPVTMRVAYVSMFS